MLSRLINYVKGPNKNSITCECNYYGRVDGSMKMLTEKIKIWQNEQPIVVYSQLRGDEIIKQIICEYKNRLKLSLNLVRQWLASCDVLDVDSRIAILDGNNPYGINILQLQVLKVKRRISSVMMPSRLLNEELSQIVKSCAHCCPHCNQVLKRLNIENNIENLTIESISKQLGIEDISAFIQKTLNLLYTFACDLRIIRYKEKAVISKEFQRIIESFNIKSRSEKLMILYRFLKRNFELLLVAVDICSKQMPQIDC